MGVDAYIVIKWAGDGEPDIELPRQFSTDRRPQWDSISEFSQIAESAPEATHEAFTCCRYYGEGYERGHWPLLCHVILILLQHPKVETVWYGGDGYVSPMGFEQLTEMNRYWVQHGNEPYRSGR